MKMRCRSSVLEMRCSEWWASSPVLWGSRHPCPLLPITHLVDFLSTRCTWYSRKNEWSFYSRVHCWELVEGSSPDAFLFLVRHSAPPRYFRPVMQRAICLGLTSYSSCMLRCVVPWPKHFRMWNASVAASSLVGLLPLSFLMLSAAASGIMVNAIRWCKSSGRSVLLEVWAVSLSEFLSYVHLN